MSGILTKRRPCDGCGAEATCSIYVGSAGKGDPTETLWCVPPPAWWVAWYHAPTGEKLILARCPTCGAPS